MFLDNKVIYYKCIVMQRNWCIYVCYSELRLCNLYLNYFRQMRYFIQNVFLWVVYINIDKFSQFVKLMMKAFVVNINSRNSSVIISLCDHFMSSSWVLFEVFSTTHKNTLFSILVPSLWSLSKLCPQVNDQMTSNYCF